MVLSFSKISKWHDFSELNSIGGIMDWQDIGYGFEAKILSSAEEIWVRNSWQEGDYPHLILDLNSQGGIINFRTSDGSHAGSAESRFAIVTLVKKRILQPLWSRHNVCLKVT